MLPYVRQFASRKAREVAALIYANAVKVAAFALLAMLVMVDAVRTFAQSDTLQLTIDPSPLFSSISLYVPLFFGILAVAGGILIGKKIALFVIESIADAF